MDLGTAIKLVRKEKGILQKELAQQCELSPNALCSIENNKTIPAKNTLNKICSVLGIPPAYLLFLSITDEDVPSEKRILFNSLYEPIKNVLLEEIESNK